MILKKHEMGIPVFNLVSALIIILLSGAIVEVKGLPLHTDSRWIVNEDGQRVKLACVNWVSHLEAVVAEGLSKQPVDMISNGIKSMGFNCVRLTWPILLVTNDSLASLTAVVKSLGNNDVMVILDNHVTMPGWSCGNTDGNGFFGPVIIEGNPHKLIFHPLTGLHVISKSHSQLTSLTLGPCSCSDAWTYTPEKTLLINNTNFCTHAEKEGNPATLSITCTDANSKWEMISDSNMHLSSKLSDGSNLCLDVDDNNIIVTTACKCLNKAKTCDPGSQ